jgi:hypothetical protein
MRRPVLNCACPAYSPCAGTPIAGNCVTFIGTKSGSGLEAEAARANSTPLRASSSHEQRKRSWERSLNDWGPVIVTSACSSLRRHDRKSKHSNKETDARRWFKGGGFNSKTDGRRNASACGVISTGCSILHSHSHRATISFVNLNVSNTGKQAYKCTKLHVVKYGRESSTECAVYKRTLCWVMYRAYHAPSTWGRQCYSPVEIPQPTKAQYLCKIILRRWLIYRTYRSARSRLIKACRQVGSCWHGMRRKAPISSPQSKVRTCRCTPSDMLRGGLIDLYQYLASHVCLLADISLRAKLK